MVLRHFVKWGINIKFFLKHYLKSDTNYEGALTEPKKTFNYYLDLIKCKIVYLYYVLIKYLKDN